MHGKNSNKDSTRKSNPVRPNVGNPRVCITLDSNFDEYTFKRTTACSAKSSFLNKGSLKRKKKTRPIKGRIEIGKSVSFASSIAKKTTTCPSDSPSLVNSPEKRRTIEKRESDQTLSLLDDFRSPTCSPDKSNSLFRESAISFVHNFLSPERPQQ